MLRLRRMLHRRPQGLLDLLMPALQQQHRVADIGLIIFRRNPFHAGRGAAMNLVQQAGARAVIEHAVFASANAENPLQQLNAFLGRRRIRIGSKVLMLAIGRAAIVGQARKFIPG